MAGVDFEEFVSFCENVEPFRHRYPNREIYRREISVDRDVLIPGENGFRDTREIFKEVVSKLKQSFGSDDEVVFATIQGCYSFLADEPPVARIKRGRSYRVFTRCPYYHGEYYPLEETENLIEIGGCEKDLQSVDGGDFESASHIIPAWFMPQFLPEDRSERVYSYVLIYDNMDKVVTDSYIRYMHFERRFGETSLEEEKEYVRMLTSPESLSLRDALFGVVRVEWV